MASQRQKKKMALSQRFPRTAPPQAAAEQPPQIIVHCSNGDQQDPEEKKQLEIKKKTLAQEEKFLKNITEFNKKFHGEASKEGGLSGFFNGKVSNLKKLGSLEGLAGLMGIKRDSGTFAGALVGEIAKRKDLRKQRADIKKEYVENFAQLTDVGRSMSKKEAEKEGEKRFTELASLSKIIEELVEKQKKAKDFNGSLSEEDTKALEEAKSRHKELTTYATPDKKQQELLEGMAEGVKEEIAQMSSEEKKVLGAADPEYLKGVFSGALESLTKVNEEQLEQLVALVKASTVSEEDKLEESNKKNVVESLGGEQRQEEKKSNLFSTIMDLFSNKLLGRFGAMFSNLGSSLLKGISSIGSLAARAGGALASGAGAILSRGATLASGAASAIGSGAARVAGAVMPALSTVGSAIGSGVSKVGSFLGSAASGAVNLGKSALGGLSSIGGGLSKALGVGARVAGKVALPLTVAMGAFDAFKGFNADENASFGQKMKNAGSSVLSGLSFGLLGSSPEEIAAAAAKTPARVEQAKELAKNTEKLAEISKNTEAPKQNVVNNSPTTIINNNTQQGKSRATVRNLEPSINSRIGRYLLV